MSYYPAGQDAPPTHFSIVAQFIRFGVGWMNPATRKNVRPYGKKMKLNRSDECIKD
jgi:hypothetical protein